MSDEFTVGQRVRSVSTGESGYIVAVGQLTADVLFVGADGPVQVPLSELEGVRESRHLPPGEFLAQLTAHKITSGFSNVLYGYLASRTIFREYQFLPALRFLESGSRRLLIADEVGLGKTIEAGLILLELMARGQGDRALFVVPPHLQTKWRSELQRRFDVNASIWRGAALDDEIERIARDGGSLLSEQKIIISQHAMSLSSRARLIDDDASDAKPSRAERLAELGVGWDLIVIDEAHHGRNSGTGRHRAFVDLSRMADAMLFLTATPLNLGNTDLFNLLSILRPDLFTDFWAFDDQIASATHVSDAVRALRERDAPETRRAFIALGDGDVGHRVRRLPEFRSAQKMLAADPNLQDPRVVARIQADVRALHPLAGAFTRTRKRDLPEPFALRNARQIHVEWTDEEWEFYDALRHYVTTERMSSPFALVMPSRQAASCIPAMLERLEENHWVEDPAEWQQDIDESGEDFEGYSLGRKASESAPERLMRAAHAVKGIDTKYDRFEEALRTLLSGDAEQVLVFSFFRKTIDYLRRRLSQAGYNVRVMNGDVPMDQRSKIMEDFRRGQFDILLSSEVGSEGLDFEFLGAMVNYDLPWNPKVVEQRIGRLDRFGQKHKRIIILKFQIPGTIETDIIDRLFQRIGVFEASIGDLDEIIGAEIEDTLLRRLATLTLTDVERERLVRELEVSIETRKFVVEQLDAHRDVLAASGDLLEEQFASIRSGGRYVDPIELRSLLEAALEAWYPETQWTEESPEVNRLLLPARTVREGPLARPFKSTELDFIGSRATWGGDVRVTFDYETASADHGVRFLTARHPLRGHEGV